MREGERRWRNGLGHKVMSTTTERPGRGEEKGWVDVSASLYL
jgi:hypothetical protein